MSHLEKIETKDGSITFRHKELDETYHSLSGALEEAKEKHVVPSGLKELAEQKDVLVIMDVCFGMGYNTLVALADLFDMNYKGVITVFAFENDAEIMDQLQHVSFTGSLEKAQKVLVNLLKKSKLISTDTCKAQRLQEGNLLISLFTGDARCCVQLVPENSVDIVFFDPFSPKKQPEMWSKEFFSTIFSKMAQGGILTTYSCAKSARTAMADAGFTVEDGPCVGRKSPGTLAYKR